MTGEYREGQSLHQEAVELDRRVAELSPRRPLFKSCVKPKVAYIKQHM